MKERVKTIIAYSIPMLIVLALDCVIMGVQGIWPFGTETIDYYDMGQQLASEYLHVYDELHGTKSLVYDWYTSLSRGIPGGTYISVFNLIYYFFPRNMILESFSAVFVIKTMCMALTMRIFLKSEVSECPDFFSIILSVGYGLCGFAIMHYTIISWLDITVLVPLIMMYTQRLLKKGEMTGYIVCVALLLLINFYIPVMCLLFVFLQTGVYALSGRVRNADDTDNVKSYHGSPYILRLGIATAAALLLSAWVWIPKVFGAAGSMRFNNEAESGILAQYTKILTHVRPDYATRWWCLLGASLPAAIVLLGLIKDLKCKNLRRFILVAGALAITFLQLVFENVNLFWHFGSYVNYPARDGFLMYIVLAAAAASYAKEILKDYNASHISGIIPMGGILVMILAVSVLLYWYNVNPGMSVYTIFRVSVLCAIGSFACYIFLILFKSGRYSRLMIFVLCTELIFYGVMLVGKPTYITGYSEEPEQDGEYIRIASQLKESLGIEPSRLDRIKNPDTTLNTNYGNVLERATFTGWPTTLSGDVINSSYAVGNSVQYTRMLDSGGNAFTDALLHTTQVVSLHAQDEKLYENVGMADVIVNHQTGEKNQYGLYNCRYILPFGTIVRDADRLDEISAASNGIDFTNAAYRAIGSDNSNIAHVIDMPEDTAEVTISGRKFLYISAQCADSEYANSQIFVNGSAAGVPTIQKPDNVWFPEHFNNNTLFLGSFCDETVSIAVNRDYSTDDTETLFTLYSIDADMLGNVCREYAESSSEMRFTAGLRSIDAVLTAEAGEYLMLPMEYSGDWKAYVNGTESECIRVNGLFMAIPLQPGDNQIHMSYYPSSMKCGIIIAAMSFAVIAAGMLLAHCDKKYRIGIWGKRAAGYLKFEDVTGKTVLILYTTAWLSAVAVIYVLPVAYGIYYYFSSVLGKVL